MVHIFGKMILFGVHFFYLTKEYVYEYVFF